MRDGSLQDENTLTRVHRVVCRAAIGNVPEYPAQEPVRVGGHWNIENPASVISELAQAVQQNHNQAGICATKLAGDVMAE
jgi:hypothetical protein